MSDTTWTAEGIKALRLRLGLNQSDFAARLGCRQGAVAMWEAGQRQPTGLYAVALDRLAAESTPPAWLLSLRRTPQVALDRLAAESTPLPPRLSQSLDATAGDFDAEVAAAIADGQPEAAERMQRIAAHLRRIAYNHRTAAAYQDRPELDPPQRD